MKYFIVCDRLDRVRVRFGKYVLDKEQCYGIAELLLSLHGVNDVKANYLNGSVLIEFNDNGAKEDVLNFLSNLKLSDIKAALPNEGQQTDLIEQNFKRKVLWHCTKHLLRYLFMPSVIHRFYVWYRAFKFLRLGLNSLLKKQINVEVLDATAILTSLCCENYSTASSTMFLLNLSDILMDYSNMRAKHALAQSLALKVDTVWLVRGGVEVSVALNDVKINDIIRVRKGSVIPVDGNIVCGDAVINEATMTGEAIAVHKSVTGTVFAGTVLEDGEIDIEVLSLKNDSRIAKIIDLIDTGEKEKAQIQGNAERLADEIVPMSFSLFVATLILTQNISRALSVLMVDFSCAIKLTTPITVISALKEGVGEGVLVKGGKFLEKLSLVDTVVFDKTGTLTNAVPKVSKIIPVNERYTKDVILRIAACLEEHFPHSVAAAIVSQAKLQGLHHPEDHGKVEYVVAHGLVSTYNGRSAIIGSRHFVVEDEGVLFPAEKEESILSAIGGDSAVYLAIDNELVGIICVNDPPRDDAKHTVDLLRAEGIKEIIMITGDGESSAQYVSQLIGLDGFYSHVLPDGKAKIIETLKEQGKTVLMVGDGINDTPALSCSDVSLTLNGSSDIAREVADVTLMSEDLTKIIIARKIGIEMMKKIERQYSFIVLFNAALIGLGIFGVISANNSALLHNASTIALTGLSTRPVLKDKNKKLEKEDETA